MVNRCPGPPHQGHASSDWTCPIENAWTITDRAILKYEELQSLWRNIDITERQLAALLLDPEIDMPAYYSATRGKEHD